MQAIWTVELFRLNAVKTSIDGFLLMLSLMYWIGGALPIAFLIAPVKRALVGFYCVWATLTLIQIVACLYPGTVWGRVVRNDGPFAGRVSEEFYFQLVLWIIGVAVIPLEVWLRRRFPWQLN